MRTWAAPVSLVLPTLHLALCVATRAGWLTSEGSWGWFLVFLVDLPVSLLLLPLSKFADPLLLFGSVGTAWWFLVGNIFSHGIKRLASLRRKQPQTIRQGR